ncbi:MAG: hypothetical protein KR126chlam5_00856 [Candidatus Anoxychlamydiales bacterium]|nr:hypothetical protein [Candidatus Anoxychlamydiales bacterium]
MNFARGSYDNNDQLLGIVDQKILRFFPTFEILSPNYLTLAKAKLNFWGTKYTITDPLDDHIIATLTRPFLFLKTNWTMTIFDKEAINERNIHPHMLLVIAAFQVDREYWQRQRYNDYNDQDTKSVYTYSSACFSSIKDEAILTNGNDLDKTDDQKIISKYLLENLYTKKDMLSDVEIDESDFKFIENFTNIEKSSNAIYFSTDDEKFYLLAKNYIDLLDANELTQNQKKALYVMLEQRLNMYR